MKLSLICFDYFNEVYETFKVYVLQRLLTLTCSSSDINIYIFIHRLLFETSYLKLLTGTISRRKMYIVSWSRPVTLNFKAGNILLHKRFKRFAQSISYDGSSLAWWRN